MLTDILSRLRLFEWEFELCCAAIWDELRRNASRFGPVVYGKK